MKAFTFGWQRINCWGIQLRMWTFFAILLEVVWVKFFSRTRNIIKNKPVAVRVSFSHFQRNTICGKSLKALTISCFFLNDIPCELMIDPQETYTTPSLALSSNSFRRKIFKRRMSFLKSTYPSNHAAVFHVIARCEFHLFQRRLVAAVVARRGRNACSKEFYTGTYYCFWISTYVSFLLPSTLKASSFEYYYKTVKVLTV